MKINCSRIEKFVLIVAILWYTITAYYSVGYHHPDEHYQIIEFAGLLEGKNTADDLAWEYKAQIRPTIQPIVCYGIFKACDFLSISDPYNKAFILRFLTALVSIAAIYYFVHSCKRLIAEKYWIPLLLLSYFLWFIPFISVRFSSETWAGILFLLSAGIVIRDEFNYKSCTIIGVTLGLSFLFRFQMAFAIIGLSLWMLFIRKESVSKLAIIAFSALFIIALGILLDSWFYGQFVLTPYNYFKVNLIDGVASNFGTAPWYYYFNFVTHRAIYPIGYVIVLALGYLLYTQPRNIIIWILIPFIVGHSIIAHKELRFLFPIANFVPLILILSFQNFDWNTLPILLKRGAYVILSLLILLNLACLTMAGIMPAGTGVIKVTEAVHKFVPTKSVDLYYTHINPFTVYGLATNYYDQQNIHCKQIDSLEAHKIEFGTGSNNLLVVSMEDLENESIRKAIQEMKLVKKEQNVPEFAIEAFKRCEISTNETFVLYTASSNP